MAEMQQESGFIPKFATTRISISNQKSQSSTRNAACGLHIKVNWQINLFKLSSLAESICALKMLNGTAWKYKLRNENEEILQVKNWKKEKNKILLSRTKKRRIKSYFEW